MHGLESKLSSGKNVIKLLGGKCVKNAAEDTWLAPLLSGTLLVVFFNDPSSIFLAF